MTRTVLDFLVVGAQKAGTTTLFKLLEDHPGIAMPKSKEVPFFCADTSFARGWEWCASTYFRERDPSLLWGKVTPQYLSDPATPARVAEHNRAVRLVVLVREPIDRCISHWKMLCRKRLVEKSFGRCVERWLDADSLRIARELRHTRDAESRCCVVWSEYARLLDRYRTFFSTEQILIIPTERLAASPRVVVQEVLEHIGATSDWSSPNLGKRFHEGGTRQWVSMSTLRRLGRPVRGLWRKLPEARRRALLYWLEQSLIRREVESELVLDKTTETALVDHYRQGVEKLRCDWGVEVDWMRFEPSGGRSVGLSAEVTIR